MFLTLIRVVLLHLSVFEQRQQKAKPGWWVDGVAAPMMGWRKKKDISKQLSPCLVCCSYHNYWSHCSSSALLWHLTAVHRQKMMFVLWSVKSVQRRTEDTQKQRRPTHNGAWNCPGPCDMTLGWGYPESTYPWSGCTKVGSVERQHILELVSMVI